MKKSIKNVFKYKKQTIRTGDLVEVITGNDKTKQGKVKAVFKKDRQIVVEGVNTRFRHIKPQRQGETGKIKQFEAPIHISNVKKVIN